jgi:hypothetical protein
MTLVGLALVLALLAPPARDGYDHGSTPRTAVVRSPLTAPGRPGELVVVPGRSRALGRGRPVRVTVEVEGGLRIDRAAFARRVTAILADRRGWGLEVRRVSSGAADFRVTIASPVFTDRLCAPIPTNGLYSCAQAGRAVLNAARWRHGADAYRGDLRGYRVYLVNHEVGHLLGHGHVGCPGAGLAAPVMMQQTKGLDGCRPNPWPLASEG